MIEVKLTGLADLGNAIQQLTPALERKLVRHCIREAMKVILEEARNRVPVDTGNLKNKLTIKTARAKSKYTYRMSLTVKKGAYYVSMVELGHFARDGKTWVPAQAFMTPAYEAKRNEVVEIFAQTFREGLPAVVEEVRRSA